jgi:hypothetical protein
VGDRLRAIAKAMGEQLKNVLNRYGLEPKPTRAQWNGGNRSRMHKRPVAKIRSSPPP